MPTKRSINAKQRYESGKQILYRDNKGHIISKTSYIQGIKDGTITYYPGKNTNNKKTLRQFRCEIGLEKPNITRNTYTQQKITDEDGREYYLKYKSQMIKQMLIHYLTATGSQPLKNKKYVEDEPTEIEYSPNSNLNQYIDPEYARKHPEYAERGWL
jgi:hypothetical protein